MAYIVDTYGESVIPNILYMTRVTQSVEKGFLYVLGVSMKSLTKEWKTYYKKEYRYLEKTDEEDYLKKQIFKRLFFLMGVAGNGITEKVQKGKSKMSVINAIKNNLILRM